MLMYEKLVFVLFSVPIYVQSVKQGEAPLLIPLQIIQDK